MITKNKFEEILSLQLDSLKDSRIKDAMRYSLMAGGKRIRPMLLLSVCEGYGKSPATAMQFACALEMIHTYSLIHDDLPAMDNDDLRRGRLTCHKQFDEASAILAGDGLLTYAFETALKDCDVSLDAALRSIRVLANAAGPDGMVYGQCLDIEEDANTDWNALKTIHRNKTGCLLSAPLEIGAILSGADESDIACWKQIGFDIGLAFQIQDDILDIRKTAEELGKSNSDERNEKVTSVSLMGMSESEALMNELYETSFRRIEMLKGFDSKEILALLKSVSKREM